MNDFLKDIIEGKGFTFRKSSVEVKEEEVKEEPIFTPEPEEEIPVVVEEVVEEKIWYTNGEKNRRYVKGEQPEGWIEGRADR